MSHCCVWNPKLLRHSQRRGTSRCSFPAYFCVKAARFCRTPVWAFNWFEVKKKTFKEDEELNPGGSLRWCSCDPSTFTHSSFLGSFLVSFPSFLPSFITSLFPHFLLWLPFLPSLLFSSFFVFSFRSFFTSFHPSLLPSFPFLHPSLLPSFVRTQLMLSDRSTDECNSWKRKDSLKRHFVHFSFLIFEVGHR